MTTKEIVFYEKNTENEKFRVPIISCGHFGCFLKATSIYPHLSKGEGVTVTLYDKYGNPIENQRVPSSLRTSEKVGVKMIIPHEGEYLSKLFDEELKSTVAVEKIIPGKTTLYSVDQYVAMMVMFPSNVRVEVHVDRVNVKASEINSVAMIFHQIGTGLDLIKKDEIERESLWNDIYLALNELHQKKWVHKDVKWENIVYVKDG